jgi:hypothetical protein
MASFASGNITIEDFFDKLLSGEYYVNPEAHNNPQKSAKLEELENWISLYNMDRIIHTVPTHQIEEYTRGLIVSALLDGVIITKGIAAARNSGEGENLQKKEPDKPNEEFLVEMLKWSSIQPNGSVIITNVQGSIGEITTIYNDTIEKIREDNSIPEEKKWKARRILSFLKEKHIYYIPPAVELFKRYLWPT